jgi:DNA-binding transcriptional ArsR family regulator
MAAFVDYKNIETDNLIMSLYMGTNIQAVYDLYGKYDLKIDKDLDKVFKYVNDSNKIDRIMINKLFKNFTMKGWETTVFHFVIDWGEVSFGKNFDEFLCLLENLDDNMILNNMYYKLLRLNKGKEDIEVPKENIKFKIDNILEILMNTEVEAEFKWYLLEACYDIKGFLFKCSKFFKQSRKVLEKKLMPFNERGIAWGEKLKERIEKEGFSFIRELLEDFQEEEYENIFVSPRIMDNYAFGDFKSLNPKELYIYIGESFELLKDIFGKENERKWSQNIIKYLSDGSRFQIMKLIKEKPRYAGELAESLGISNATISHHTTLLCLVKLLEQTKINNRSYMSIRNDSLDKFLEVFKKEFNLEEGGKV